MRLLVVLAVVAVAAGAFLFIGFDDARDRSRGIELGIVSNDDGEQLEVPGGADDPTATSVPAASIPVYAANGSGIGGQALAVTEQLRAAGFTGALVPGDATPALASQVFFLPERDAEGQAVATALGLAPDRVVAWPSPPPFEAPPQATVIVHVGPDLAG